MTRKDYIKLATVLNENRPPKNQMFAKWDDIVHGIAQVLGDDNPRFDYDRFYTACGREADKACGQEMVKS